MADITDKASGLVGQMFSGSLAIVFWVIIGVVALAVIFGIYYYFFVYKKKFDIMVKVISERAEDDKVYFDKAALLYDKTNRMALLRLWASKVELPLPKFKLMHHTNKGDYIEIHRLSDRSFRFMTPPYISKKVIIKEDGKVYPVTQTKQIEIENDLAWILHRTKVNKSIINPESLLMKLLQYAPQIISGVLSLMVLWIALRYAPDLLNAMRNFAETIKESSQPAEIVFFNHSVLAMENENIIMDYIAAWNWHISALIFLVGALIEISISIKIINTVLFIAFIIGFLYCEMKAHIRKNKLEDFGDES